MDYAQFKKEQDRKNLARREELIQRGNQAYNKGLWDAVKWNPFKWWVFAVYHK